MGGYEAYVLGCRVGWGGIGTVEWGCRRSVGSPDRAKPVRLRAGGWVLVARTLVNRERRKKLWFVDGGGVGGGEVTREGGGGPSCGGARRAVDNAKGGVHGTLGGWRPGDWQVTVLCSGSSGMRQSVLGRAR